MGDHRQSGNPNLGSIAAATVKALNAAFFTTSLVSAGNGIDPTVIRLHLSTTTAALIQYTIDDKTTWVSLNSGQALIAGGSVVMVIPLPKGGKFNLRCVDAAGTTINICEVDGVWG